ncbi:MAG: YheC/YheD family protein [Defluviitaleaceae bacterium]|nr:YheC/YheD family protein [Defluviitaleaceae bacterium]
MKNNLNNIVGYWVKSVNPNKISATNKTRFGICSMYGIDFFIFSAKDVNLEEQTINGLFWDKENFQFARKKVGFPPLIDFRMGGGLHREHPNIFNSLKLKSYIIPSNKIGGKDEVGKWLLNTQFKENVIPTTEDISETKINEILNTYNSIILKPTTGSNGRGIYKISKDNGSKIKVHYETKIYTTTLSDFLNNNFHIFKTTKYLAQAFINSTSIDGQPIDIRLNLARGVRGKFYISDLYARFGGFNYIGTNMGREQRAVSIAALETLKYQFGEKDGQNLYKKIQDLGEKFPNVFQKKLKFITPELCLDLGIDRESKQIYIFEVGVSPGNSAMKADKIPIYNVEFYKYLLDEYEVNDGKLKKQPPKLTV